MSDIVEFLKARLDEDEKEARDAIAARESIDWPRPELSNRPDYGLDSWPDLSVPAVAIGPERLLREVKAKRDVIYSVEVLAPTLETYAEKMRLTDMEFTRHTITRDMLLHMAAVYAHHPDYREEWRVLIA